MKTRILTFGLDAEHEELLRLSSLFSSLSFSDYDAFVFKMSAIQKSLEATGNKQHDLLTTTDDESGVMRHALDRHSNELLELLWSKGGVVLVLLGDNHFRWNASFWSGGSRTYRSFGPDSLIARSLAEVHSEHLLQLIANGAGKIISIANQTVPSYLRILKDTLYFEASLAERAGELLDSTFATDSVGKIVAGEIKIGAGSLLFLPQSTCDDRKRLGSAIVQTVRERLRNETPDVTPDWVEQIAVPGSDSQQGRLTSLTASRQGIDAEILEIERLRDELLAHRRLLYTTGRYVLEPAVRDAFRVIGYEVRDPESYDGEWDLEMNDSEGSLVIGEVEGPEGPVDLDKFRQALDYHNDRLMAGEDNKGILVGNSHRLLPLDRRETPFTEHAVRAAERTDIALIPTPDLFRAVCDVLDGQESREKIQLSIKSCKGVWSWPSKDAQE